MWCDVVNYTWIKRYEELYLACLPFTSLQVTFSFSSTLFLGVQEEQGSLWLLVEDTTSLCDYKIR